MSTIGKVAAAAVVFGSIALSGCAAQSPFVSTPVAPLIGQAPQCHQHMVCCSACKGAMISKGQPTHK